MAVATDTVRTVATPVAFSAKMFGVLGPRDHRGVRGQPWPIYATWDVAPDMPSLPQTFPSPPHLAFACPDARPGLGPGTHAVNLNTSPGRHVETPRNATESTACPTAPASTQNH